MSNFQPSRPRHMSPRRMFAIVASQFNGEYVHGLVEEAKRELAVINPNSSVTVYEVPGAFEIPLIAQELATKGRVDAIIALGVIIEGKTQHATLIGEAITTSLQKISLAARLPIIHGVLLVKDEEQARERCLGKELNRGTEAARAACGMVEVMGDFRLAR